MDIVELYDDLVAIRRTAHVMHDSISQESRDDLQVVLKRIKGKLQVELKLLPEDELGELLDELDKDYANEASGELRALIGTV